MEPSFVAQKEAYMAEKVEEDIEDLEKELEDEEAAAASLANDTQAKIDDAKAFVQQYSSLIGTQAERIEYLNSKIRELVAANEAALALDEEYKALVASEEYLRIAAQLVGMKTTLGSVHDYLVKKGRRGRPAV